ncbi:hypothetical protein ACIRLA_07990 [Streptomyces sp. NPDC102364]|uniref:hypothetical protein n=1 Tax=Streptomyces sp. NPDC102364 TaxID=3366161 RepID=UPI00380B9003
MAKGPAVIGVLTEPARPTWWKANRHIVLLILGLIVGFHLASPDSDAKTHHPKPSPASTVPATPTGSSATPSPSH